jgi:hypothetical protein
VVAAGGVCAGHRRSFPPLYSKARGRAGLLLRPAQARERGEGRWARERGTWSWAREKERGSGLEKRMCFLFLNYLNDIVSFQFHK